MYNIVICNFNIPEIIPVLLVPLDPLLTCQERCTKCEEGNCKEKCPDHSKYIGCQYDCLASGEGDVSKCLGNGKCLDKCNSKCQKNWQGTTKIMYIIIYTTNG